MKNISDYGKAARMHFGNIELEEDYAQDTNISEALSASFHDVEISSEHDKGLAHSALNLAQKLAENANSIFLNGNFENMRVEKSDNRCIAVYGNDTKLADVRVSADIRDTDPKAVMANGDKIGNLQRYDWNDIEKLEKAQISRDFAASVARISETDGLLWQTE